MLVCALSKKVLTMTPKSKSILAIAAIALTGAVASVAMYIQHPGTHVTAAVKADVVNDGELASAVRNAGLPIRNLFVRTVGDITVLRGDAPDPATITRAGEIVQNLGARRVANLIHVPTAPDDQAIRIAAERQLAQSRALDGCTFTVSCNRGVLKVGGRVQSDMQADAARSLLNQVPGVERIEVAFVR